MVTHPVQFTAKGVTARLFEIIQDLPEERQRELFVLIGDNRQYERKSYIMCIDYETHEGVFQDFILDISPGGVFIETQKQFFSGQDIRLSPLFRNQTTPFKINGMVVWQNITGIGVKFIYSSLEQREKLESLINQL